MNTNTTNSYNKLAKSLAAKTDWLSLGDNFPTYLNSEFVPGVPGYDLNLNNSTGFTALPGALRRANGVFGYDTGIGGSGYWWYSDIPDVNYLNYTKAMVLSCADTRFMGAYYNPRFGIQTTVGELQATVAMDYLFKFDKKEKGKPQSIKLQLTRRDVKSCWLVDEFYAPDGVPLTRTIRKGLEPKH